LFFVVTFIACLPYTEWIWTCGNKC